MGMWRDAIIMGILTIIVMFLLLKVYKIKVFKVERVILIIIMSFVISFTGATMNVAARFSNGGEMPVKEGIEFRDDDSHKRANENTKLRILIDNYDIDKYNAIFSIGDITFAIGLYICIASLGYLGLMIKEKKYM